jgi:Xaa-Pro dipeptidase
VPAFEASRAGSAFRTEVNLYPYSDEEGHEIAFENACRDLSLASRRVGVEYLTMRVLERQQIEAYAPGAGFFDADRVIAKLRMCKDEDEIGAMRQAARVNEQAYRELVSHIRPGVTEKELATEYRIAAWRAGAEDVAFDPIILGGPNGANPHQQPGDRALQRGEFVTVDCGVRVGGYCSDITRTYAVGPVGAELQRIYATVLRANAAARAFAAPGRTAQEVDAVARRVIRKAGYGPYFTHRTGHGLGLDVHEPPYIVAGNELVLCAGMVFTIEPGIYVPGLGGVRIEDNVVLIGGGAESLTSLPRELTVL